jgi:HPt (histidine-containing phosphotransfer) domain-containing protein
VPPGTRTVAAAAAVESADSAPTAIDHAILSQYWDNFGDDAASVLAELVPIYLEEAVEHIEKLHQAVELQNADQLRRSAHALKGSSYPLGAMVFADLCKELEECGRHNDLNGVDILLLRTQVEFDRLVTELNQMLETGQV